MTHFSVKDKIAVAFSVFMPLMTLFGIFLFVISLYIDRDNQKYAALAQTGIGVMSQPLVRYTKVSDDFNYYYEIKPKFTTITGETKQCTDQIDSKNLIKLGNEPSVMVYYQTDNPSICQVKGSQWRQQNFESARRWSWILIGTGVIGFTIALTYRKRRLKK